MKDNDTDTVFTVNLTPEPSKINVDCKGDGGSLTEIAYAIRESSRNISFVRSELSTISIILLLILLSQIPGCAR